MPHHRLDRHIVELMRRLIRGTMTSTLPAQPTHHPWPTDPVTMTT
jgi:hypothetical protein